jgi:quinol monooxygenase YgiN
MLLRAILATALVAGGIEHVDGAPTKLTPIVRLAELEIDPAQLPAYTALLREEIEASIASEPGVLMLYAVAIKGRPNQIRLTEVYADEAGYRAHIASPHFQKYKKASAKMVRSLVLHETDPILLSRK